MLASLPMYDWPEIRAETDQLWQAIAGALGQRNIAAPAQLERQRPREDVWTDPALLLSQTCGLPYMRGLRDAAHLLGAPVYALPDLPAGDYCSVIVARKNDSRTSLAAFRNSRVAYNAPDSQSGYAALLTLTAPLATAGRFFSQGVATGAHRLSLQAVAGGMADLAACDAVSWLLALDHEPAAKALKVITTTPETPGLPLITAQVRAKDADILVAAVQEAIAALAPATRRALHLRGFRPRPAADYQIVLDRLTAAAAQGYPVLQ